MIFYCVSVLLFVFCTMFPMIQEITTTKNPSGVKFVFNDHLALIGKQDCNITNIASNTKYKQLSIRNSKSIISNNKKNKIGIVCDDETGASSVIVYDAYTGKHIGEEFKPDKCKNFSATFALDDTLFVCGKNFLLDNKSYCLQYHEFKDPIVISHPIEKELLVVNKGTCVLSAIEPRASSFIKSFHTPPFGVEIDDIMYSPNGEFVLFHDRGMANWFYLYNCKNKTTNPIIGACHYVAFHSNNILAWLDFDGIMQYWDTTEKKVIACSSVKNYLKSDVLKNFCIFDFSFDRTKVAMIVGAQCFVLDVPFDAIYRPETKDRYIFAYCLLQRYSVANNFVLLHELSQLLMKNILELSKFK